MNDERQVGGLWCHEVLAALADYVDDALDADRRVCVERHVRGCDRCAQFGEVYGRTIAAIRARLAPAPSSSLVDRILGALDER